MKANKWILPGLIIILLAVIIGGTIVLFTRKPRVQHAAPLTEVTMIPTVEIAEIIEEIGAFLILPNNYTLSESEVATITSTIKTIFLDNPTTDYTTATTLLFPNLVVNSITADTKYTFCNTSGTAVVADTARSETKGSVYISKRDCSVLHKTSPIVFSSCKLEDSNCQTEYLITLQGGDYYYNSSTPLLALQKQIPLTLEAPLGTAILTWAGDTKGILQQNAYSYEVLNTNESRVYASGKVNSSIGGEYFSPQFLTNSAPLTFKVHLWLQYKNIKFKNPLIITADYVFPLHSTPIASESSSAKQSSWIPDWGMADGIESVKANPKKWDTISPVWFIPNKNGSIEHKPTTNSATLMKLLRDNRIRIIPTISLFDADILKEILNRNLEKHVNEIVKLVVANDYDGIDLDYESTYEDDSALLLEFLTLLGEKLHAEGKTLVFTALPKIDDRSIYSFLPQTHKAQNWKAIGAIVDEFRIMAYDFTGQGSLQPGPLSPYAWNETLIRYAITQMPASKVVLALPLYSHGWPKPKTSNLAGTNNDKSLSSGELKNTISLQHDSIAYVKGHSTYYREKYDPVVKEVRAELKYNGVERVMYYLDKTAVNNRLDLAKSYGIKGICYWRIGGERL